MSPAREKTAKGFTLIELMVVITIIAILSTVGLVLYSNAQKAVRFSKRMQDVQAIKTALEIYKNVTGTYPNPGWAWRSNCSGWGGYNADQIIPGLVPGYMPSFPEDPQFNRAANSGCYIYLSNGTDYKFTMLGIAEITDSDMQKHPNLWDPSDTLNPKNATYNCTGGDNGRTFAAYSTGGACW
jgi:prepilin-type N-terminal cleavage/methylation domain-containing protein